MEELDRGSCALASSARCAGLPTSTSFPVVFQHAQILRGGPSASISRHRTGLTSRPDDPKGAPPRGVASSLRLARFLAPILSFTDGSGHTSGCGKPGVHWSFSEERGRVDQRGLRRELGAPPEVRGEVRAWRRATAGTIGKAVARWSSVSAPRRSGGVSRPRGRLLAPFNVRRALRRRPADGGTLRGQDIPGCLEIIRRRLGWSAASAVAGARTWARSAHRSAGVAAVVRARMKSSRPRAGIVVILDRWQVARPQRSSRVRAGHRRFFLTLVMNPGLASACSRPWARPGAGWWPSLSGGWECWGLAVKLLRWREAGASPWD